MDKPPAIQVRGLHRNYGSLTAVQNLEFSVRKGEIFSLLGPIGAGKSTTL
jgi:ABC-type multidrug transport system ATPase subunit